MMDLAAIERIGEAIKKHLLRAKRYQDNGDNVNLRAEAETAATHFRQVLAEAGDPLGLFEALRAALISFGYTDDECATLLAAKKKKKIDVKGKSSGGSEHQKGERPSTTGKHQKSRATKRKSYGGEKGDDGRRYPRKKPGGWAGPWPPPEEADEQPHVGRELEGEQGGVEDRTEGEETDMSGGKEQYEQALRLARDADRSGTPLPVTLLQEAAQKGYPPALYALANWHLHGKGVKKDYKKAASLLLKAANARFAPAAYDLAVSYELGKGVEKSEKKAWLYYLQAANGGHREAQTEAARCFYHGIGTKQDFSKAVEWYRKAALRGDSNAQYALGVAYEHGEGVKKDLRTAINWYKKSATQGDREAQKALVELQEHVV